MYLNDEEFQLIIKDFIESDEFQILANRKHHIQTSLSDHVMRVAYLCYRHNKKHANSKADMQELIRAAMLHDFFFSNAILGCLNTCCILPNSRVCLSYRS